MYKVFVAINIVNPTSTIPGTVPDDGEHALLVWEAWSRYYGYPLW